MACGREKSGDNVLHDKEQVHIKWTDETKTYFSTEQTQGTDARNKSDKADEREQKQNYAAIGEGSDCFTACNRVILDAVGHGLGAVSRYTLCEFVLEHLLGVRAEVARVGIRVDTLTAVGDGVPFSDVGFVSCECARKLFAGDVIREDALSQRLGEHETLQTVTRLHDSLDGSLEQFFVEHFVVDAQAHGCSQVEPLIPLGGGDVTARVGDGDGVGHVDVDGVAVTERREGRELESGGNTVTTCDHTVKPDLVEVWRLELRK